MVYFPLMSQWEKQTSHTQLHKETATSYTINNDDITQLGGNAPELSQSFVLM
jgi:hypothetical protein